MSSKDTNKIPTYHAYTIETHTMHSKSDNIEIMIGNETDEIMKERFDSLIKKYQKGLEELMKGSEFVFASVDSLHYKYYEIILNRGGSYVDYLNS